MARTSLPPGFRFHPTDIELIMYYLKRKILGKKLHFEAISELNIYKFSPWDLPDKSCLKSKDLEWYFFCPRERKYASGDRMKRGTETGFWKTTGKDRSIMYDGRVVGMVKTLVFHEGNAPRGKRTDWLIYEYRMDDKKLADDGVAQDGYVLYKVFKKNGPGPKNGAQYGAPFVEEEWDNDDSVIAIDSFPGNGSSSLVIMGSENQNSTASKSLIKPVCTSGLSIVGSGPAVQISPEEALVDGPTHSMVTDMFGPPVLAGCAMNGQGLSSARSSSNDVSPMPNDDIACLLDAFTEDPSFPNEQGHYELGESSHSKDNSALPHLHGNDPFNGLEDLGTWAKVSGGVNFSHDQGHNMNNVLAQDDDMAFLELNDLDTPLNFPVESGGFQNVPTSTYAACNPNTSQHLSGSAQQNFSANLGQICSDVNFPSSETVFPRLSQCSMLPNSSGRPEGSTNVFPTGNTYENIFSQGYTAGYNLHSFSYRQAEEFVDAANYQERAGVPQRKNLSRLQQMLGSFTTVVHDPASVAHAPSNSAYGGSSSIHVKAEVISTLSQCTKDALSVMLEESTYDYSCWWNLHGAEFWKKATADCSNGYGCVLFTWTNVGVIPPSLLLLFLEMLFLCFTCCTIMNMMILVLLLGETFFHEMLTNFFLFLSFSKFRFRSSSFPSFIFLHVVLTGITVLK